NSVIIRRPMQEYIGIFAKAEGGFGRILKRLLPDQVSPTGS
ncbi:MAG: hypothetical protein ACI8XO_004093, partial [Verrucomicrobiales bacterium]